MIERCCQANDFVRLRGSSLALLHTELSFRYINWSGARGSHERIDNLAHLIIATAQTLNGKHMQVINVFRLAEKSAVK